MKETRGLDCFYFETITFSSYYFGRPREDRTFRTTTVYHMCCFEPKYLTSVVLLTVNKNAS